jgi:hypothetical protein
MNAGEVETLGWADTARSSRVRSSRVRSLRVRISRGRSTDFSSLQTQSSGRII